MENKTPTNELVRQLSEIDTRINSLEIRKIQLEKLYNEIMLELWKRFPHLEQDQNMQMKGKVKTIGKINEQ